MTNPYFAGLATGAGLIIAIGAQNAFVLNQGIRRRYTLAVPLVCALCDILLIGAGVAGLGRWIQHSPRFVLFASRGGALFLFLYGLRHLIAAWKREGGLADPEEAPPSRRRVLLATLGVTLLNPHVYLDTVVLLGSLSAAFPGRGRYLFGAGAATASLLWFFGLSLGASRTAPFLRRRRVWRVLDVLMGLLMWFVAFGLSGLGRS